MSHGHKGQRVKNGLLPFFAAVGLGYLLYTWIDSLNKWEWDETPSTLWDVTVDVIDWILTPLFFFWIIPAFFRWFFTSS